MAHHHDDIVKHYATGGLLDRIAAALDTVGKDRAALTPRDLAPVDAFHQRGWRATVELAELAGIPAGAEVLDLGSGLGGTARYLAAEHGCRVTGLDLTPEFCTVAGELSRWVGLAHLTRFEVGDAAAPPFPADAFDLVWCEHVQMNVADKDGFCAGIRRVLRPGGRFVCHEVFSVEGQEPHYPVPWATGPELSFPATAAEIRAGLIATGLTETDWRDITAETGAWHETVGARLSQAGPPPLGLHLISGADTLPRLRNLGRSLVEGRLRVVQGVFRNPDQGGDS